MEMEYLLSPKSTGTHHALYPSADCKVHVTGAVPSSPRKLAWAGGVLTPSNTHGSCRCIETIPGTFRLSGANSAMLSVLWPRPRQQGGGQFPVDDIIAALQTQNPTDPARAQAISGAICVVACRAAVPTPIPAPTGDHCPYWLQQRGPGERQLQVKSPSH